MVIGMALRSAVTRTVTALLVAAALVATPSSAEARQYVHNDPRGDMYEVSVSGTWPIESGCASSSPSCSRPPPPRSC